MLRWAMPTSSPPGDRSPRCSLRPGAGTAQPSWSRPGRRRWHAASVIAGSSGSRRRGSVPSVAPVCPRGSPTSSTSTPSSPACHVVASGASCSSSSAMAIRCQARRADPEGMPGRGRRDRSCPRGGSVRRRRHVGAQRGRRGAGQQISGPGGVHGWVARLLGRAGGVGGPMRVARTSLETTSPPARLNRRAGRRTVRSSACWRCSWSTRAGRWPDRGWG